MKVLIVAIPAVLEIAMVAALYFAATTTPAPQPSQLAPASEIRQLHLQRDQIEARLAELESHARVFLPRGMGKLAYTPQPSIPEIR